MLVLRGCGPKGYPGCRRPPNTPLPAKLLAAGRAGHGPDQRRPDERHGLRHRRAARRPRVGGGRAAALVRDGDMSCWTSRPAARPRRPAEELAARRPSEAAAAAYSRPLRGWQRLYVDHVMQADKGVDLDFLVGVQRRRGHPRLTLTISSRRRRTQAEQIRPTPEPSCPPRHPALRRPRALPHRRRSGREGQQTLYRVLNDRRRRRGLRRRHHRGVHRARRRRARDRPHRGARGVRGGAGVCPRRRRLGPAGRAAHRPRVALGARNLAAITPYYLPAGPQSLIDYYRRLDAVAGEARIFVYLYGARSTTTVTPAQLAELAEIPVGRRREDQR